VLDVSLKLEIVSFSFFDDRDDGNMKGSPEDSNFV
jgi:hypothetical protein